MIEQKRKEKVIFLLILFIVKSEMNFTLLLFEFFSEDLFKFYKKLIMSNVFFCVRSISFDIDIIILII